MNGTIFFQVEVGGWNYSNEKKVDEKTTPLEMVQFLVPATKGVDGLIGLQLKKLVDFTKIEKIVDEAPLATNASELGKRIAFLNARKTSQAINEISALEKLQSKERSEVSQFIRLYLTRKIMANHGMFVNYAHAFPELHGKNEGKIRLISNNVQWKSIKKFAITEKTDPRTFMEFLGSFSASLDNKLESYLGEIVDLKKIETMLNRGPQGKTASDLEKIFPFLNGNDLKQAIASLAHDPSIPQWLHVYANRQMLEKSKLFVKFSQVEIPGMKRLLKKKT